MRSLRLIILVLNRLVFCRIVRQNAREKQRPIPVMQQQEETSVSTHVLNNFSPEKHLGLLAARGIRSLELSCNMFAWLRDGRKFAELRRLLDAHAMRVWSIHAPFTGTVPGMGPLDISLPEDAARETAMQAAALCLERLEQLRGQCLVIHPSCGPIEASDRPRRRGLSLQSLAALASGLPAGTGVRIAIENLPGPAALSGTSSDLLALVRDLNDARFGVCLDVNHANLCEDLMEATKRLAPLVVTTHVSDNDGVSERHWMPGRGKIPFRAWVDLLRQSGYAGPFVYETSQVEDESDEATIDGLVAAGRH